MKSGIPENGNKFYRVTQNVGQNLPLTPKTKVPFWPVLSWPVQAKAEHVFLKSTGGFGQRSMSPCTHGVVIKLVN